MVNKLLIGLGIAGLVLIGSVGVWKVASDDGARRVAALGEEESPTGAIRWRGAYEKGAVYAPMDVVSYEGSSWIATDKTDSAPPDAPWDLLAQAGEQGAPGAAGTAAAFSGTLQSPNGSYTLTVANDGITLRGPNGRLIELKDNGLKIEGGQLPVSVRGDAAVTVGDLGSQLKLKGNIVTVEGSGPTTVKGATINLCGLSGARPVAHVGDPVLVTPGGGQGQILPLGPNNVLAC